VAQQEQRTYGGRQRSVQIDDMTLSGRGGSINLFDDDALMHMNIFEDIFSNFTTGNVTMIDNGGFFERFPICGDEKISVSFKPAAEYPGPSYIKKFEVYLADEFTTVSGSRTRVYQLHFATPVMMLDRNFRLRRPFKGMTEDKIVSLIAKNQLNVAVDAEGCRYPRDIVIPGWRPLATINYMARSAVRGSGYPSSNYLFFEDRDQFRFVSIDKMIEGKYKHELDFHVSRTSDPRDISKVWNCNEYQIVRTFNRLENSIAGMYAHRVMAQDIIKKQIKKYDYLYSGEFDAQKHVDAGGKKLHEIFSSSLDQRFSFIPQQKGERYESEHADDYVKRRAPMVQEFFNYALECETEGNTNVLVGDKVRFNLTSNISGSDEDDSRLGGDYLISKIMWTITNKEVLMKCMLAKDDVRGGD
jgi:hypothetical protein